MVTPAIRKAMIRIWMQHQAQEVVDQVRVDPKAKTTSNPAARLAKMLLTNKVEK